MKKQPKETPAIVKAKQRIEQLERDVRDWTYTAKQKDKENLELSIRAAGKERLEGEVYWLRSMVRDLSQPQVALALAEKGLEQRDGMVVHR